MLRTPWCAAGVREAGTARGKQWAEVDEDNGACMAAAAGIKRASRAGLADATERLGAKVYVQAEARTLPSA